MDEIKEYKNTLIAICAITVAVVTALAFVQKESITVRLHVMTPDTRIYKNARAYTQTSEPNQTVSLTLKEGQHTLLADADNRWPWKKDITVTESNEVKEWTVFSLPRQPRAEQIETDSSELTSIQKMFNATTSLPTKDTPLVSSKNDIRIWVQNTTKGAAVKARAASKSPHPAFCSNGSCQSVITSFTTDAPIRNLQFFENTDDVLIYAAGRQVLVREIDPNGTQNVQPVFVGSAPTFRRGSSTHTTYVRREDGDIFRLRI